MNHILTAAAVLALTALPAFAEEPAGMPGDAMAIVDADGDGNVTAAEMDAFVVAVFPAMDTNGDGSVDKAEALVALSEDQFAAIDANADGLLSADELAAVVRADFAAADRNGDGVLN